MASYRVACKLKYLKNEIKGWAEEIRREGEELCSVMNDLGELDLKERG